MDIESTKPILEQNKETKFDINEQKVALIVLGMAGSGKTTFMK